MKPSSDAGPSLQKEQQRRGLRFTLAVAGLFLAFVLAFNAEAARAYPPDNYAYRSAKLTKIVRKAFAAKPKPSFASSQGITSAGRWPTPAEIRLRMTFHDVMCYRTNGLWTKAVNHETPLGFQATLEEASRVYGFVRAVPFVWMDPDWEWSMGGVGWANPIPVYTEDGRSWTGELTDTYAPQWVPWTWNDVHTYLAGDPIFEADADDVFGVLTERRLHFSPSVCTTLIRAANGHLPPLKDLADAVLTFAHEAAHGLRNIMDESAAECYAMSRVKQLGKTYFGVRKFEVKKFLKLAWQTQRSLPPEYRVPKACLTVPGYGIQ